MRTWILFLLLFPQLSHARFLVHYSLNFSTDNEQSDTEVEMSKTFHKAFIGASVNSRRTLFFGWNINYWNTEFKSGTTESKYNMTEMGLRVKYFFSESYSWYTSVEWNPLANGKRADDEISGNSNSIGLGYRFKVSSSVGLGAGIHYHTLNIKESKVNSTVTDVSDKRTSLMPMLELTIMTR
jgi:predicted porin